MKEVLATIVRPTDLDVTRLVKENITINIEKILSDSGYNIKKSVFHVFDDNNLTWGLVLAESHFILHTYSEYNSVLINLFVCKDEDEKKISDLIDRIAILINGKVLDIKIIERVVNATE